MVAGAARLDADRGEIVGFALANGLRPARIKALINGSLVTEGVAVADIGSISRSTWQMLPEPPSPICAFALKLPATCTPALVDGGILTVVASESGVLDDTPLLETSFDGIKSLACFVEGFEMADSLTLEVTRLRAGVFSGRLQVHHDGAAPDVRLRIRGEDIGAVKLTPTRRGHFDISATLPAAALDDGVSVVEFVIQNGEVLARYPLSAGAALAGDLAAEVGSLRAELDQLKSAFRGAMAGGVITRDERPMIIAEALTQVDNILEMRDRSDRFERVEFDDPSDDNDDLDWDIEA
ncbi:MAG: hypothetical protein ACPG4X_12500 [Pikeienuella sp.]